MIRSWLRIPGLTGWAILAACLALLIGFAVWKVGEAGRDRERAAIAKAEKTVAEGQIAAGRDAVAIVSGSGARDAEIDQQTRETADAIRNTPGADQPLDPRLDAELRRRLCLRASSAGRPECRALSQPGS